MNSLQSDFLAYFKNLDGNARTAIAENMPIMNPEGRMLSETNCVFLAFQSQIKFTIVGGFKQWMKHGRCVKKGQHGNFIFIPAMIKTKKEDGSTEEELDKFLVARVFDISQTFEIKEPAVQHQEELSQVEDCSCDYDCTTECPYYWECSDEALQDPDLGGTGHGDISWSDADPGL